jgi:plasmid replication initiation protein
MEAPLFSLKTQRDLRIWRWESKDKTRSVTITPSVIGRATQFDKDVLIFLISEMTAGLNLGRPDARYRTVQFCVHDYLVTTNKSTRKGGVEYLRLQDALARLRGTTLQTNIKTGGIRVKEGFGFIDSWAILEKSPTDGRVIQIAVTLSEWLFNAVQAREVLTINPAYFRIRGPIERRVYELARKHCGAQPFFSIGTALLHEKAGSSSSLNEFRRALREIIAADSLPDYRLAMDEMKGAEAVGKVLVYNRDVKKLVKATYRRTRRIR